MSSTSTFPLPKFVRRIGATRLFAVIDLPTDDIFSPKAGSSLFGWLLLWRHRSIERRALLELTADRLADIGLTADAVRSEARRWPWDGRDQPR